MKIWTNLAKDSAALLAALTAPASPFPLIGKLAASVFPVAPSSAEVERLFSFLKFIVGNSRGSSKAELVSALSRAKTFFLAERDSAAGRQIENAARRFSVSERVCVVVFDLVILLKNSCDPIRTSISGFTRHLFAPIQQRRIER